MRVFQNEDTGKLINGFTFPEPIADQVLPAKRGDSKYIDLAINTPFPASGGGRQLAAPYTVKFMAKVQGDNDGPAVVSNYDPGLGDFVSTEREASGVYAYRLTPGWNTAKLNNLLGHDPEGFKETTTIRCVADIAESLHEKFFILQDRNGSVGVWFDLDGTGTAPAGASACTRQIEISTVSADDAAGDVATSLAAALDADAEFTATAAGSLVTVEDAVIGARPLDEEAAGDSGFVVSRWIAGSLPNTMENVDYVDLDAEFEITEDGAVFSSGKFTMRVENDIVKGNEGVPSDAQPAYPAPGELMIFKGALTGLTGGGATNLDGLTTANGQYNGRLIAMVEAGSPATFRIYELIDDPAPGVTVEDDPGIILPDDHDPVSNPKIWIQRL
jgi:hypothetical protein